MARSGPAERLRRLLRVGPVLALAACASGEGFDPAGWVTGEVAPPERISTEGFDADAPFPNLSRVPDRPPRPTPKRERLADVRDLASQRGVASPRPAPAEIDTRPGAPPPPAPPPPGATPLTLTRPRPTGTYRSAAFKSPLALRARLR